MRRIENEYKVFNDVCVTFMESKGNEERRLKIDD